jgi:hypothetical protein
MRAAAAGSPVLPGRRDDRDTSAGPFGERSLSLFFLEKKNKKKVAFLSFLNYFITKRNY